MVTLSRIRRRLASRIVLLGLVGLLGTMLIISQQVSAQTAPTLGVSGSFAVLGSTTVTNTGSTVVNGDLGVSPGNAVTGFYPPGIVTAPASIHAGDAAAA